MQTLDLKTTIDMSTPRARILNKIKDALRSPTELPFPDVIDQEVSFNDPGTDLKDLFASEFTGLLGNLNYCTTLQQAKQEISVLIADKNWEHVYEGLEESINTENMHNVDVAITDCECLVARTGTVVVSSSQFQGRTMSVYAPVHIIIAYSSQLVYNVKDALHFMKNKYAETLPSLIAFTSGPSRTGDIEKTLIVGVHGPKNVYLYLLP